MTRTRFAMVSKWMTNGDINRFVMVHKDANRFELVRPRSGFHDPCFLLTIVTSVVGRRCKGLDLSTKPETVHVDLKGVCLPVSALLSISNLYPSGPIFLLVKGAMPAWQTLAYLQSYRTPQVMYLQVHLHVEAHPDGRVRSSSILRISALKIAVEQDIRTVTHSGW